MNLFKSELKPITNASTDLFRNLQELTLKAVPALVPRKDLESALGGLTRLTSLVLTFAYISPWDPDQDDEPYPRYNEVRWRHAHTIRTHVLTPL